mgnify:CR=1 FL=1
MIVTRALVDILNLNTAIPRTKICATFPRGFFCGFCCCNFFGFVFYRCFDKTPACFFVVTVSLWDHQVYKKYIFPWELSICLDSHNFQDILERKRWIHNSYMTLCKMRIEATCCSPVLALLRLWRKALWRNQWNVSFLKKLRYDEGLTFQNFISALSALDAGNDTKF